MKKHSYHKILVIRFSSLGDVVLSTVVLPELQKAFPQARLLFLTKEAYREVLLGSGEIDEILTLRPGEGLAPLVRRLRGMSLDLIVDLHGNLRSTLIRWMLAGIPSLQTLSERWNRSALVWFKYGFHTAFKTVAERHLEALRRLGVRGAPRAPVLDAPDHLPGFEGRFHLKNLTPPLTGWALGSKHATKRWNPRHASAAIENLRHLKGGTALLLGGPEDKDLGREISSACRAPLVDLTGKTSLSELMKVLSSLELLVTVDSGLLHLAEALGVPVLALFGPTVKEFGFAPSGPHSRLIERPLPCRPCSLHGGPRCPLGHHQCLEDISPEEVARTACEMLGGRKMGTRNPSASLRAGKYMSPETGDT